MTLTLTFAFTVVVLARFPQEVDPRLAAKSLIHGVRVDDAVGRRLGGISDATGDATSTSTAIATAISFLTAASAAAAVYAVDPSLPETMSRPRVSFVAALIVVLIHLHPAIGSVVSISNSHPGIRVGARIQIHIITCVCCCMRIDTFRHIYILPVASVTALITAE